MAKWKSLLDWCAREFKEAVRYFVRVPQEYYLAMNMMETLRDARDKEMAKRALDICNHWIELEPVTPLTGCDDEWEFMEASKDIKIYINKRYSPLFKIIKKQGLGEKITYSDRNRVEYDGDEDYITFVREKIDEIIPITFPYNPEKLFVNVHVFYNDKNKRYYIGFKNFRRNDKKEEIPLHKYYCFDSSLGGKNWEISVDKYLEVVQEYIDRPWWGIDF